MWWGRSVPSADGSSDERKPEKQSEASEAVAPVVETFTPEQQAQFEECTDALGG